MPRHRLAVRWQPRGFAFAALAEPVLREALSALRLTPRVAAVVIRVRRRAHADDGCIRWTGRRRLRLSIELDVGNFLSPRGRRALGAAGLDLAALPRRRFAPRTLAATLCHELAHVADDVRYGIHPAGVPRPQWPAFNEAWNVWIDGRLARTGLPGVTRTERWREFLRAFPASGRGGWRPAATIRTARRTAAPSADRRRLFDRLWTAERLSAEELRRLARAGPA